MKRDWNLRYFPCSLNYHLEYLKPLRNLKELVLSFDDHLSEGALQWMIENWPSLRDLKGDLDIPLTMIHLPCSQIMASSVFVDVIFDQLKRCAFLIKVCATPFLADVAMHFLRTKSSTICDFFSSSSRYTSTSPPPPPHKRRNSKPYSRAQSFSIYFLSPHESCSKP